MEGGRGVPVESVEVTQARWCRIPQTGDEQYECSTYTQRYVPGLCRFPDRERAGWMLS